jgi:hypothetical protein
MVRQAEAYSSGFPGGVIYYTNSSDLAVYYTRVFRNAGLTNFRFVIMPAVTLDKMMIRTKFVPGGGEVEIERQIDGTRPGENLIVRYVSFDDPASIPDLFHTVLWKIDPPVPNRGGAVLLGELGASGSVHC